MDLVGRARHILARVRNATALGCLAIRKNEPPKPPADLIGPHPRRVYEAVPEAIWTNVLKLDDWRGIAGPVRSP